MKKGCLLIFVAIMVLGVFGAMLNTNRKETTDRKKADSTAVEQSAESSGTGKKEAEIQVHLPAEKKVAEIEAKPPMKYFAETPKEAEKDKLTIDGSTYEGISKVTLKEGDTPAPFVTISIMHSSGVKTVRPSEVPLAFAELWELSDADVQELDEEIVTRKDAARKKLEAEQIAQIEAKTKRDKAIKSQFSPWNGSHDALTRYIKKNMNDPDSYEHVETRWIDKGDFILVIATYRGKNAFGGVVKNTTMAKVDISGNILEIIR